MAVVGARALPRCRSTRVRVGFRVAQCLGGGLGFSRFNDPKRCSNARAILQVSAILKYILQCTNNVLQTPWLLHSPGSGRQDDAHAGPLPPLQQQFFSALLWWSSPSVPPWV